jgi:hypothetical protein
LARGRTGRVEDARQFESGRQTGSVETTPAVTFAFPEYMVGRRRLILSTDAKNEADDQYAICSWT